MSKMNFLQNVAPQSFSKICAVKQFSIVISNIPKINKAQELTDSIRINKSLRLMNFGIVRKEVLRYCRINGLLGIAMLKQILAYWLLKLRVLRGLNTRRLPIFSCSTKLRHLKWNKRKLRKARINLKRFKRRTTFITDLKSKNSLKQKEVVKGKKI